MKSLITWLNRGFWPYVREIFWRFEPGLRLSDHRDADWKKGFDFYSRYNFDEGVKDIAATVAVSRTIPGSTGKVGVMGFCLGGLMSFLTAARVEVDAAVEYYGAKPRSTCLRGSKSRNRL